MKITKHAVAGTLESSDVMVTVEPCANGLKLEINSVVLYEYGAQIEQTARAMLHKLDVQAARIEIDDHGALDCILSARLETALRRAEGVES